MNVKIISCQMLFRNLYFQIHFKMVELNVKDSLVKWMKLSHYIIPKKQNIVNKWSACVIFACCVSYYDHLCFIICSCYPGTLGFC